MLKRTVGLAAGVGISNWLLRRRSASQAKDPDTHIPAYTARVDVQAEVYRLRGETVSVGGLVEWIIAHLAGRFARTKKKNPKAQWNDLKRHLKSSGLRGDLQTEIGLIDGYFKPRNLAAHAGMIITGVADATQIIRLQRAGGDLRADLVTLDSLQGEVTIARASYDAILAIGRSLDDHEPSVLAGVDDLTRAMLLGRT